MLLNCGIGENSRESLGLQRDLTSSSWRKSVLNIHWKDWCWSWSSNTLVTCCEELTHCKRPWFWERLKVAGKGHKRGWDVWMTSLCQWIWGSSVCWWWTGKPGVLQSTVLQRVRHDGTTGLNWTWEWHRRVSGLTRVFLAIEQPLSLPCTVSSRTNSLSYYLQKPTHRKCHGSLRWGFTWDTSCNFLKQGRKSRTVVMLANVL